MADTHFHANVHVPGYLPEGDVLTFGTLSDAWDWLREEMERDRDNEVDGAEDDEAFNIAVDTRYTDAIRQTKHMAEMDTTGGIRVDGPTSTHLGLVYEVVECGRDDMDEEE